jgi:hypothetical protein
MVGIFERVMRRFTLQEDINNVEWSSPIEFL